MKNEKAGKIAMIKKTPRPVLRKFERIAQDVKTKLQSSGVSGICYMGIKEGEFSGGIVGDVEVVAETLLIACKRNPSLYHLLDIVVRATKDAGFHQAPNESEVEEAQEIVTSLAQLVDLERLDNKVRNILEEHGILDITQLSQYGEREVQSWSGIGKDTMNKIKFLMTAAGVNFRGKNV